MAQHYFRFFSIITSKENFILYASEVKDFSITNFRNDVAKNLYSLCDIIAFDHIEKITDKYEIYGNSNLTQKEFNQKVENGNDKYKNSNDLYNFFRVFFHILPHCIK